MPDPPSLAVVAVSSHNHGTDDPERLLVYLESPLAIDGRGVRARSTARSVCRGNAASTGTVDGHLAVVAVNVIAS